jgi:hypothetical protein
MAKSWVVFVVLVALVAAAVTAAPSNSLDSAASSSQGVAPSPFKQCGGVGGSCSGSKDPKCKDARWPANQGGSCEKGLNCYKISPFYWQCDTHQPPRDAVTAYTPADFHQCGGTGGACTGSNAAKCKDAQWPANQGGACKTGLTCFRISQYYRGCDVKKPASG